MEVVPYWKDLSSKQQEGFVVQIVDKVGGLLLTVPFMEAAEPKASLIP
jgi:hypothetical protein